MTVLIISRTDDDYCTPLIHDALQQRGARVVRFNTDQFPTNSLLASGFGHGVEAQLIQGDQTLDLNDVSAIYFRRWDPGAALPQDMDPRLRRPSKDEAKRTVLGLVQSCNALQVDPYPNIQHAENKMLQLSLANEVGLSVPPTLLTNHGEDVAAFLEAHPGGVMTKMQSSFKVYTDGVEHVMYTNLVDAERLGDMDGLELCPMMFQAPVPKRVELRVTVVGKMAVAAQVPSQKTQNTQQDWRRDGYGLRDQWLPYTLPPDVEAALHKLMDRLQLNYGAVDMIVTPDDDHVFLEVNPVGEWFWLDQYNNFTIAGHLADLLLGRTEARKTDVFHDARPL